MGFNFIPGTQLPTTGFKQFVDASTGVAYYAAVDASGNPTYPSHRYQQFTATFTGTSTGTSSGVSTAPVSSLYYVPVVESAAVGNISVNDLNGTSSTSTSSTADIGISVSGQHLPSQLPGGLTNQLDNNVMTIEQLIASAKSSADTQILLRSGGNYNSPDPTMFGDATNLIPKVVYATGATNANGTVSEGDLHFGGGFTGCGLLIVEIWDPNQAKLVMDGSSMWVGQIIIVAHYIPTQNNSAPLTTVGGGGGIHIVGGATVFDMNQLRPTDPANTSLLGQTLTKFAGNADLQFSSAMIDLANKVQPSAVQVRSWRKVRENE